MTTPAIGTVSPKIQLVTTYTLPATIAQTRTSVQETVAPTPRTPSPTAYITNGNVSSSPDNPAMVSIPSPVYFTQAQNDAIRSAARNTALAFNLPVTIAGDRAVLRSNEALLALLRQRVANSIDETIIPT